VINMERWSSTLALRYYRRLAVVYDADFARRYDWVAPDNAPDDGFDEAEVTAIYGEIIDKIPADASVLEIGCGGGQFAEALKTAKPGITYKGIDLVPENIDAAEALLPAEDFHIANAWEFLKETAVDWDFIVSVNCLFTCTEERYAEDLFTLVDSKAPKGFFVLATGSQEFIDERMTAALAASTNVSDSYHQGARDWLTDATLKSLLRPFYILRDSTSTEAPALNPRVQFVRSGRFNRVLGRADAKEAISKGEDVPEDMTGVVVSGGLITGRDTIPLKPAWVPKASKKG